MAVDAHDVTIRLTMNEHVSVLVLRLDALNPYAVRELVLRNCVLCEPAQLCTQISRCVRLRRLSCVGCALQPSRLVKLMLELQYLQHLELSLVEDSDVVVDSEIDRMRSIAPQMWGRHPVPQPPSPCRRLHEDLDRLETFTFTSEPPASVPFPYGSDRSLTFTNCAAVCANVRRDTPHDWWSCVELRQLELGRDRALILPSQLVTFAAGEFMAETPLQEARQLHSWQRVRELCILLLPEEPDILVYPKAGAVCRRLPPCWFPKQSSVRTLALACPNLRDLDVRVVTRGGFLRCSACNALNRALSFQEPSDEATRLPTSVARLTLSDVTYRVLLCIEHLPIENEHFQASLSRMTSLQHLCLLTSMLVSDAEALECVLDSAARSFQLKCVHIHYRRDTDLAEQRVTWLKRQQGEVHLLRGGPCFSCCSTATFIGLVKPVNRDCEADFN
ncbi:hypothetical protein MTO96_002194 [Rhipicephalus appendiculatus]